MLKIFDKYRILKLEFKWNRPICVCYVYWWLCICLSRLSFCMFAQPVFVMNEYIFWDHLVTSCVPRTHFSRCWFNGVQPLIHIALGLSKNWTEMRADRTKHRATLASLLPCLNLLITADVAMKKPTPMRPDHGNCQDLTGGKEAGQCAGSDADAAVVPLSESAKPCKFHTRFAVI